MDSSGAASRGSADRGSAEGFVECWHRDAPRLLLYARRHAGADEAADVVAEAFTIAWRRWEDVPDPAIGWLISTARNVIHSQHRRSIRRDSVIRRLHRLHDVAGGTDDITAGERTEALQRLAALKKNHREALLLVGWDGLSTAEAAEAAGIKPAAFRTRLHRARHELESGNLHQLIVSEETS